MKKHSNWVEFGRFCLYLFVIAGFITSNMLLFLTGLDIPLNTSNIGSGWFITLLNVIGLTLIVWLIDRRRRRTMIDRPVAKIREGIDQITAGDFSTRIDRRGIGNAYAYGSIVDGINKMTEELSSVETLKTDFIANVSHEMKTPLAVIKNYAELLQAGEVTDEHRLEYAAAIGSSAGRMAELITNILRLSRIENQKIIPKLAEYDLCRQLCDCILQFEDRWEAKGLELDIDLEDSAPIHSDADLLALVWNNLLSNAVKFTPDGGTVRVVQRTEGDRLVVTVSDTGPGMTAAETRRAFDRFYQGDTSHAAEGNGLGLALVKRVLDLLGGEITVESEPGKGSAFTVKLKVAGNN